MSDGFVWPDDAAFDEKGRYRFCLGAGCANPVKHPEGRGRPKRYCSPACVRAAKTELARNLRHVRRGKPPMSKAEAGRRGGLAKAGRWGVSAARPLNEHPRQPKRWEFEQLARYRSQLERGFALNPEDLKHYQSLRALADAWDAFTRERSKRRKENPP